MQQHEAERTCDTNDFLLESTRDRNPGTSEMVTDLIGGQLSLTIIKSEIARWAKVIKATDATAD